MKKIITTISLIILVAVVATTLFACSSATTQGQLQNILNDHGHEKFVYDVYSASKDSSGSYTQKTDLYQGTYTVTLDACKKGANELFNDVAFNPTAEADGVLVKGVLNVGTTTYETGCYFNLIGGSYYMVPAYSYRVQKDGETESLKVFGAYADGNFSYTRYVNGNRTEGSLEVGKALYYDNNEFHQALRTITTFSDSLSYSFSMPLVSATEAATVSLSTVVSGRVHVKTPFTAENADYTEKGIECYKTYVSRATDVAGISQTLYYAANDVKLNGWGMKHVLVKIEEPFKHDGTECAMIYELKTAELA